VQQIEVLQQRLKDIEARGGGEQAFILYEHSFSSFAELKDWVLQEKNIPSSCCAYWDLFFSIMVTKEPADKVYSSSCTKTTMFANDLLATISHEKPECLSGTKKAG
jgi:hypothetical protein